MNKIIIDTDPGVDDALAIMLALGATSKFYPTLSRQRPRLAQAGEPALCQAMSTDYSYGHTLRWRQEIHPVRQGWKRDPQDQEFLLMSTSE